MATARTQQPVYEQPKEMLIVRLKDPSNPADKKYEKLLLPTNKWIDIEEHLIWKALRDHKTVLWNPYTKRKQDKSVLQSAEE